MKRRSVVFVGVACLCASASVACGSSEESPAVNTGGTSGASGSSGQGGSAPGGANSGGASGSSGNAGRGAGGANGGSNSGGSNSGGSNSGGSNSGGSGNGGSANGGAGGSGTGGAPGTSFSVLQRGKDLERRATFTAPDLTVAAASRMAPNTTFNDNATFPANGNLDNMGTASVLYLQEGPIAAGCPMGANGCQASSRAAGSGLFFAFPALGADPNVVAFDETTGLAVWTAHVQQNGDGIRGTPVVDPKARRLYLVTGKNPHVVRALSVDNGAEVTTGGWPVTLSNATLSSGGTVFNSNAQNQHGALLFMNDILYIPFGGQYGDGGTYRGWIVAVDVTDPSRVGSWMTRSPRSGIWGSGGLVSDGSTYVFGVTGDTTGLARDQSDSEEVMRVSGLAAFTRDAASVFVPTQWQSWDRPAGDLDFGSATPAYVPLPAGSNPRSILVAPAKAGRIYYLDGDNLSSGTYPAPGGQLADLVVASTTAEAIYTAPTVYRSASGLHATINAGVGPTNCPGGNPSTQAAVIATLIEPGKTPLATEVWCAPSAGGGHRNYPPISTTTDGQSANALVWFLNGNQLTALDGDTGQEVVKTNGASCDSVPSMSFPIAVKNRIVVSALGHLCSWSPDGT